MEHLEIIGQVFIKEGRISLLGMIWAFAGLFLPVEVVESFEMHLRGGKKDSLKHRVPRL